MHSSTIVESTKLSSYQQSEDLQQQSRYRSVIPTSRTASCSKNGIYRSAGSAVADSNTLSSPLQPKTLRQLFERMTDTEEETARHDRMEDADSIADDGNESMTQEKGDKSTTEERPKQQLRTSNAASNSERPNVERSFERRTQQATRPNVERSNQRLLTQSGDESMTQEQRLLADDAMHEDEELTGELTGTEERMAGDAMHEEEELTGELTDTEEQMAGDAMHEEEELTGELTDTEAQMAGDAMREEEELTQDQEKAEEEQRLWTQPDGTEYGDLMASDGDNKEGDQDSDAWAFDEEDMLAEKDSNDTDSQWAECEREIYEKTLGKEHGDDMENSTGTNDGSEIEQTDENEDTPIVNTWEHESRDDNMQTDTNRLNENQIAINEFMRKKLAPAKAMLSGSSLAKAMSDVVANLKSKKKELSATPKSDSERKEDKSKEDIKPNDQSTDLSGKPDDIVVSNKADNTAEKDDASENLEDELTDADMAKSAFGKSATANQNPAKGAKKTKGTNSMKSTKSVTIAQNAPPIGIRFQRIEVGAKAPFHGDEVVNILECIAKVDPDAILLPHNAFKKQKGPIKSYKDIPTSKYRDFFDISSETWGHARENKRRVTMSLYLESNVIGKTLKELYNHETLKATLKETNIRMTTHCLHESQDAEVGFFTGKATKFTWRDDMAERIKEHLKTHTNSDIPVAVRNNIAKSDDVEAEVVAIFVGKRDYSTVIKTLKEHPFTTCEIVFKSLKGGNPEEWKKRIRIHTHLSNESRAIKIHVATSDFRDKLQQAVQADEKIYSKVIDIARVGFPGEELTLYIQCHSVDKELMRTWLKQQIPLIHPAEESRPYINDDDTSKGNTTRTNKGSQRTNQRRPMEEAAPSKFGFILDDDTYKSTKESVERSSRRRAKIPAIIFGKRSWADVAGNGTGEDPSTVAPPSPDRSIARSQNTATSDNSTIRTGKSQREIELEQELEETMEERDSFKNQLESTKTELETVGEKLETVQEAKKMVDDANDLLVKENKELQSRMSRVERRMHEMNGEHKMRIEEALAKEKESRETMMEAFEEVQRRTVAERQEMLERMQEMQIQLHSLLEQQSDERDRKKQDRKETPGKPKGNLSRTPPIYATPQYHHPGMQETGMPAPPWAPQMMRHHTMGPIEEQNSPQSDTIEQNQQPDHHQDGASSTGTTGEPR